MMNRITGLSVTSSLSTSGGSTIATLIDLLRERAQQIPDERAFTFLADGERDEAQLSYGELDAAARRIASRLQADGARGERVLLLYPSGLDYIAAFFGCLYAGAIAVPAYPPDPTRLQRELGRFRAIVADSAASTALTTRSILEVAGALHPLAPELGRLRWIATDADEVTRSTGADWRPPAVDAGTIAFLQYTSGSTSAPKGVMLSHGNLLANEAMIRAGFAHHSDAHILGWLPLYHDMGLIGNVLQPVYLGASCVLMSPIAFLQRPLRWLEAISRYRATTSGAPNFGYELCIRKTTPAQRAALDLGSWDVAFCGAEPVRADTLARFAEAFAPAGFRREAFYPCYGLAEASLIVTGGVRGAAPILRSVDEPGPAGSAARRRTLVGCGTALGDGRVRIVDPETRRPCASGASGEIWVAGPHVAAGYWRQPELSAQTFAARTADGDGPYLRTGDLGQVDASGELFISGRLKELIIVRGRNHFPQDLEHTVERSHPALRPGGGVAIAVDGPDGEALVIVHEVRAGSAPTGDEITAAVLSALAAEHELRPAAIVLVEPGTIPKTSSGKLQRLAARDAFVAGAIHAVHRWTEAATEAATDTAPAQIADRAAALTARIAGAMRVAVASLDPERPLAGHGLDSLAALEIQTLLAEDFGIDIPVARIAGDVTLAELSARLAGAPAQVTAPPPSSGPGEPAAGPDGDGPITHGQRGLWLLQARFPASTAYNVTCAFRALDPIDPAALSRAITRLTARHAALRTVFPLVGGEPVARVLPAQDIALEVESIASGAERDLEQRIAGEARRPFSLTAEPAVRLRLLRCGPAEVLLINAHHIACDLWSLAVMADELGRLYREELGGPPAALGAVPGTMTDHAARQRARLDGEIGERLLHHARQRLAGAPTALGLATDRPRPARADERGARLTFAIDGELVASARRLAGNCGASLYSVLLAAFAAVLRARAGQDEMLIASPAANRSRPADHGLVGFLVNPVVIRASTAGRPTFAELTRRVHASALDALEEQELPFPLLVERIGIAGDASGVPLVQVAFGFQRGRGDQPSPLSQLGAGAERLAVELGPLRLESIPLIHDTAQFDLALVIAETASGATGMLVFRTALFDAATAAGIVDQLVAVLAAGCAAPDAAVDDLIAAARTASRARSAPAVTPASTPPAAAPRAPVPDARLIAGEVAALWQELFGVAEVGPGDNFFDLGGHSLLAIRLTTMIRDRHGVEVSVAEMFHDPTVAGTAALIAARIAARAPAAAPELAGPRAGGAPPLDEVCAMWGQLFGTDDIAPDANFFDLGGHSLLAIRLTTMIRDAHGIELSVAEIFQDPTVAGLARLIGTRRGGVAEAAPALRRVSRAGVVVEAEPSSEPPDEH